jgi:hypothetical protein
MAETWTGTTAGAQSADVHLYQSTLEQTYTQTGIVDLDGESRDLGAPQVCSARLTIATLTGTTQLLDVKLQHRDLSTDSWIDVTAGAFTQASAAGSQALMVALFRFVRVVTNYTNTITVATWNVKLTLNN